MKYFIQTFGCAANVADSERLASYLEAQGMVPAKDIKEANFIVINTCMVRQSAEDRVYGLVNNLSKLKIILTGCLVGMAIKDKTGKFLKKIKERMPEVDEFLPIEEIGFDTVPLRRDKNHALVPISNGCNNFCTYCVVPYTRGREVSRPMNEILEECRRLKKEGYTEITLVGQNVNSYGSDLIKKPKAGYKLPNGEAIKPIYVRHLGRLRIPTLFPYLLEEVAKVGFKKIDFISSNPWDFSDELIETIARNPKISRQIHLPVQSGDNEVLKKMNRWYTAEQYLALVSKVKSQISNLKISTDIIVGFCGETEKQFQNTVDLVKKANFTKAYISMYSDRPLTAAHKVYKDNVPYKEKKRRWKILENLINKPNMNKILIICGPTSTGKTKLALELAKKFNGELISADSRQIYKGMDIGTGKDLPMNVKCQMSNVKWKRMIPCYQLSEINLWLYDIVEPNQSFSVADYYQLAWLVIEDIWKRGKLPILVGGTGFYIKAVVDGIDSLGTPPNYQLRKKLDKKSILQLQEILKEINLTKLNSMNNSDRNNKRRLVRAIEISLQNQKYKSRIKKKIDTLMMGLISSKDILYQKIDERVEKRVKQGIIKEIQGLLDKGYRWDLPAMSGLGYRQWKYFFRKKETKEKSIQKWKYAEHSYAKRQLTWFKKDKRIIWYDIDSVNYQDKIVAQVSSWHL